MYLNKDVNTLSRRELAEELHLPQEAVEAIVSRRQKTPFLAVDDLLEIPGLSEAVVRELTEKHLLSFGPVEELGVPVTFPKPAGSKGVGIVRIPKITAGGLAEVFLGLSHLFNGLADLSFQGQGVKFQTGNS